MRKLLWGTSVAVALLVAAFVSCNFLYVSVEDVIDGDTIKVEYQGRVESVRLLGIDAPERKEPGWFAAKYTLTHMLLKPNNEFKKVRLVQDVPGLRDHYGRLLCYVEVEGRDVGLELLKRGYVALYDKYNFGRIDLYRGAVK